MKLNHFKRMLIQKTIALVLVACCVVLIVKDAATPVLLVAPLGLYLLFTKKEHINNAMARELFFWCQCIVASVVTVGIMLIILL